MKNEATQSFLRRHIFDMLAIFILIIFFAISLVLIHTESITTDEQAHIPAAYSYVMLGDFTLNPEHPPLAKLISGLGFIGSHYNFPTNVLHQKTNVNNLQWATGLDFLYHRGNNPDSILLRSRLPILIAVVAGLFICYLLFADISNEKIAFLTLLFTAWSPTVLGHGHLVTTDVLVMVTTTIAILCFIHFLRKSSVLWGSLAGFTLGLAELSKFSAALLFVFYVVAAAVFYYSRTRHTGWRQVTKLAFKAILPVYGIALLMMYTMYAIEVIHLSRAAQDSWITRAVRDSTTSIKAPIILDINHIPLLQPVARYLVGLTASFARVTAGQGANLLGKDYEVGTVIYFPVVSVLKTPSPLLVVWGLMLGYGLKQLHKIKFSLRVLWRNFVNTAHGYPVPTLGAIFTALYFIVACSSKLDIGVRHILPLFPWMGFFVAIWLVNVLQGVHYKKTFPFGKIATGTIVAAFVAIALLVFPDYLPYTTEFAGGAPAAYHYYNDSNVDWGQSIKYFANYVKAHPKDAIYTDNQYIDAKNYYTCGSSTSCPKIHYINDGQAIPKGAYFAVSEMQLTIDWAHPRSNDALAAYRHQKPVVKLGDTIYLYRG